MNGSLRPFIDLIRARSVATKGLNDYETVELAALLFAIGEQLLARWRTAEFESASPDRPPRAPRTADELLDQLATLHQDITPARLYEVVTDALVFFDNRFSDGHRDRESLRGRIRLPEIDNGQEILLGGEVFYWLRPPSKFAELRRSREFTAVKTGSRLPPSRAPHPNNHLASLSMYRMNPLLPRVDLIDGSERTLSLVHDSGEDALRGHFRVALCPLSGPFHPRFAIGPEGAFFTACRQAPMAEAEALGKYLDSVLDASRQRQVHLLVLPELTIDPAARKRLVEGLATHRHGQFPYGVVAGSFHIWPNENEAQTAGSPLPVNEAPLLDYAGRVVLEHRKRGRFRLTRDHVRKSPDAFEDGERHAQQAEQLQAEIYEQIRHGKTLRILETALGRLAVLICADAIEPDEMGYLPVVKSVRPDLLLVVSMSAETERFEETSQEMARHGIGTVFVNAACVCQGEARATILSCDLALFQPRDWAPTWLRWRAGVDEIEFYDRYPPKEAGNKARKGWKGLSQLEAKVRNRLDVSWLSRDRRDEQLGVVLDLGSYWSEGDSKPEA